MGIKISKDHLHPSVIESITSLIGDLSQLETTAKGNAVEAINELLANGGNKEELEALIAEIAEGKELIANAVGEPLTAEESFDEMSSDINSLLSTFKTNMMNNGITVESGDKFKALIDKIVTLKDSEGKGIQFAEGILDDIELGYGKGETIEENFSRVIVQELNFVPTFIAMRMDVFSGGYSNTIAIVSDKDGGWSWKPNPNGSALFTFSFNEFTDKKFELNVGTGLDYDSTATNVKYYAIGVGEEDTTLRDSLASILENKGVDVTEEDDMASLISKVDNMSVFQYGDTEGYDYNIAFVNKETVTGNTYTTVLEKIIPSGISVVRLELFLQAGSSSSVKAYCTVKHLRGETVLYENEYSSNSYGSYQEKGNTFEVIEGDVVQVQLKAGDAYSSAIISNVSLSVSAK